ncbi:MAG TPA: hypothetical protein VFQ53_15920 [Kofleriaceae bacterium]|nr:hypothetical protein [Kofleriaceae bacterium]
MARTNLTKNLVIYRAKPGSEDALLDLCKRHAPALRASGLVTDEPIQLYRAQDLSRRHGETAPYLVERFEWKTPESGEIAHQSPEIMSVWEPMGNHLAELTIYMLEPIT